MSRSLRPSEADSIDDAASQAIMSDEEDGIEPPSTQDSVPQLIMPSIQMPSRRPFTENGKRIGRLKVLVAGAPGNVPLRKHFKDPFLNLLSRCRQDLAHQVYCADMRRHCSR